MIWFILGPLLLYLIIQLWQTITLFQYKDIIGPEPAEWPFISIMVAARNEEACIGKCIESLCKLDYPKDKLLILIGNDQSTDSTAEIVQNYVNKFSFLKLIHIIDDDSGLKAKARVMAQLDRFVKGSFYLVTDADVEVKPSWAKGLVRHMTDNIGVASGTTMVRGSGLWDEMQGIDWAYFMGLLNVISYSGIPATAVGNNMIVREDAYWQTGGYAAIKFSITEDYKLYSEICKLGWKWNNIMSSKELAFSKSSKGFIDLLHQRKRWLSGGKELPWYWWIFFITFGAFYFLIPVLFFFNPVAALLLWLTKWSLQVMQVNRIYKNVGEKRPSLLKHITFEFYLFMITTSTACFFVSPWKTIWKGRKY
jgi:cellulose synthase/poly-beta-1,6-N-acetylglucosamine synthase-like glycosyltransferase